MTEARRVNFVYILRSNVSLRSGRNLPRRRIPGGARVLPAARVGRAQETQPGEVRSVRVRRRADLRRRRAVSGSLLHDRDAVRDLRRRGGVVLPVGGQMRQLGCSACRDAGLRRSCSRSGTRTSGGRRVSVEVQPRRVPAHAVDTVARWAQASSVWPLTMGLACCAIEMMTVTVGRVRHRAPRLGGLPGLAAPGRPDDRLGPRRAEDGAGRQAALRPDGRSRSGSSRWARAPPRGGVFDNYAVVQGVDTIMPVDVYVPGCPPTPDGLLYAVNLIQQQISKAAAAASSRARSL